MFLLFGGGIKDLLRDVIAEAASLLNPCNLSLVLVLKCNHLSLKAKLAVDSKSTGCVTEAVIGNRVISNMYFTI